jgi:hypothetical protein
MGGTHSKDYISNYGDETAFASGKGSTAYGEEAPTVIGDLSQQDYPFNTEQKLPVEEQMHNEYEASGQKATQKATFNEGKSILPGSKDLHFQSITWLTKALAQFGTPGYQECGLTGKIGTTETGLSAATTYYWKVTTNKQAQTEYSITTGSTTTYNAVIKLMNLQMHAVAQCCLVLGDFRFISNDPSETTSTMALAAGTTGTDLFGSLTGFTSFDSAVTGTAGNEGQVPKGTWFETFKNGQRIYDAFGNYITKFDLDIKAGSEGIKQTIEYDTYNVKASSYAGLFKDWLSPYDSPTYIWDEFALAVNGVDSALVTAKLTIENNFIPRDEKQSASVNHKFPYFFSANFTLEVTQRNYDLELFTALEQSTVLLVPIVLEWDTHAIIITNLKMVKDTNNEKTMPEKGIKEYSYSLDIGDAAGIILI